MATKSQFHTFTLPKMDFPHTSLHMTRGYCDDCDLLGTLTNGLCPDCEGWESFDSDGYDSDATVESEYINLVPPPTPPRSSTRAASLESYSVLGRRRAIVLEEECNCCMSESALGVVQYCKCSYMMCRECYTHWSNEQFREGKTSSCPNCRST